MINSTSFTRRSNATKAIIFSLVINAGCGYSEKTVPNQEQISAKLVSSDNICKGNSYIQCEALKYDGNSWSSLGKFRSLETPGYNSGEPSCNAELEVGNIHFSADGNFNEGLIYFGSIYDRDRRVGSQTQLARRNEISLYLLLGKEQYSLECKIQRTK